MLQLARTRLGYVFTAGKGELFAFAQGQGLRTTPTLLMQKPWLSWRIQIIG